MSQKPQLRQQQRQRERHHRQSAEVVEELVRLLAAAFSLTGDFVGSRDEFLRGLVDIRVAAPDMLQEVGRASLDMDETVVDAGVGFGTVAEQQIDETSSLLFSIFCFLWFKH